MSDRKISVLGAGSPILDILVRVDNGYIEKHAGSGKGGSCLIDSAEFDRMLGGIVSDRKIAPGGSSANTIFGLAKLGIKTAFLGKVGGDDNGRLYLSRYEKMGGCTDKFKVNPGLPTGRCLCMITPDSERTMRTDLGAAMTLSPEDVADSDFADSAHLHVEGYLLFNPALALKILDTARKNGCTVSLDLSSFQVVESAKDILAGILKNYVDIVFANEDEAAAFSGGKGPEGSLGILAGLCGTAAVKLGRNGALIRRGGETAKIDALIVDAVDTTGAGDLWAAGFLYGLLNGKKLRTAGKYGSILGAEVVKIFGADIPDETWREIRRKLAVKAR